MLHSQPHRCTPLLKSKQYKIKPTGKTQSTIVNKVPFHLYRDESIISNTYAILTFKTNMQMKEVTKCKRMDSMT